MEPNARKLAALAVFGAVALFSPVVGAFSGTTTLLGIPVLPAYLFGLWGLLIVVAWWIFQGRNP